MQIINSFVGKIIDSINFDESNEGSLQFIFDDGTKLKIVDYGGQCCEKRYMVCDDSLHQFKGDIFMGVEIKSCDTLSDNGDCVHEVQFLEVFTNKSSFVVATHNEHNGYYSGFAITGLAEC